MFPIRDLLPSRTVPVVTKALIAINVAIFVLTLGDLEGAARVFGAVAAHFTGATPPPLRIAPGIYHEPVARTAWFWVTPLTHMFVHGSVLHLLGNVWFLWIFGDNVEDRLGRARYLALYFVSGFAALVTQIAADPSSGMPMVGASGAISGVLGAYMIFYPNARVLTVVPLFFLPLLLEWPAKVFLGLYLLMQLVNGLVAGQSGIAWWAHIGGFVLGMVLARPLAPPRRRRIEVEVPPRWTRMQGW
jgi:hypothetical protein